MSADRPTPETDDLCASGKAHYLAVSLCRRLERQRDAAVEALKQIHDEPRNLAGIKRLAANVLREIGESK